MAESLPPGVRPPLAIPHSRGDEPTYGNAPAALGVTRRRALRARAPELATLQWSLPAEQLVLWHEWFEDTLQAGARSFALQVQGRYGSASLQTVVARFAGPPRSSIRSAWATITADVVIGEPATIVTSQPYPLAAVDGLQMGVALRRMSFGSLPTLPEALNLSVELQGGALRDGSVEYAMADEAVDLALELTGGSLTPIGSKAFDMADEAVELSVSLQGGAMADVLIEYQNYGDEAVDLALVVQSGTLQ